MTKRTEERTVTISINRAEVTAYLLDGLKRDGVDIPTGIGAPWWNGDSGDLEWSLLEVED